MAEPSPAQVFTFRTWATPSLGSTSLAAMSCSQLRGCRTLCGGYLSANPTLIWILMDTVDLPLVSRGQGPDCPLHSLWFYSMKIHMKLMLNKHTIAVKRGEIEKMESITKDEERKLEKAERRMEKDAAMFDAFLKENHNNSVEALRKAKRETSAKTKKITEIQGLTTEIKKIQSEISRFEDTLQEYKMYRDILYQLSPKEWQEEHRKRHKKEKDKETEPRNEGSASQPSTTEQGECQQRAAAPAWDSSLLMDRRSSCAVCLCGPWTLLTPQYPTAGQRWEREPELYFTDPEQLLNTFMEMLDENLSFLLNSRDIAETQAVESRAVCSRGAFPKHLLSLPSREKELAALKEQVNTLRASVAKEEEKVAELKLKVQLFSSGEHKGDDQDKMLTSLNKKVQEVYFQCTGDNEANLPTVEMLKVIEKQLNDLLDSVERIPAAKIEKAVKDIRKEQRIPHTLPPNKNKNVLKTKKNPQTNEQKPPQIKTKKQPNQKQHQQNQNTTNPTKSIKHFPQDHMVKTAVSLHQCSIA
uniref:DUF4200 domain-containing protein n=1 Tax=Geospiza parvula TaxID=87175 RepID=A0A8C3QD97_GEOPR